MKKLKDGWEIKTLGEIATISSGGTPSRKNESYWNGSIPWVTTAEVKFNTIVDTAEKITDLGLSNSSAKLFPIGTILMAMYGQGKTRGQVAKLGIKATTNQACAAIILKENYHVEFYYQYLMSKYDDIREMSNSGGQENLSASIVKSIAIPVPPLEEQIQIAETLSTWDKAIQTTEKLLENSRRQKKALMQRLLNGKNWKEIKLADICKPQQWETISSSMLLSSGYSVYGANGFIGYYEKYNHENETVTVTCRGSTCGEVLLIPAKSYITGNSMCLDDIKSNICDYKFIYYLLKYRGFRDIISGSAQPQITGSAMKKIKIKIPDLIEQQKIAEILSTADQEIETLQRKLECLKLEKGVLMQRLLVRI